MNAFPVRCRISYFIPVSGKSFAASHFTFVFPLATSSITSPTLGSSIAAAAVGAEFRTNLLFSFEKLALRDAIKSPEGEGFAGLGCSALAPGAEAVMLEAGRRVGRW